jgi:RNA polymerase sigma-70 factor (ECF subfamily)
VQETYLRAWRSYDAFEGRSSLRTWLHRIATNVCLTALEGQQRRPMPTGLGAPASDATQPVEENGEIPWLEPVPDAVLEGGDPAAVVADRDSIRLAFVAALQHLPARQRAVLILRDVLGFSGAEVAAALDTTPASVYSLLQRAHATLDERLPDRSQQATLRLLGDEEMSAVVNRFVDAWSRSDVDSLAEMLTETASLAMPPTATWLRGREAIATFLGRTALDGTRSWRMLLTSANGQPATVAYIRDASGRYRPYGVTVLTLSADGIAEINTFRDPSAPERFGLPREI